MSQSNNVSALFGFLGGVAATSALHSALRSPTVLQYGYEDPYARLERRQIELQQRRLDLAQAFFEQHQLETDMRHLQQEERNLMRRIAIRRSLLY